MWPTVSESSSSSSGSSRSNNNIVSVWSTNATEWLSPCPVGLFGAFTKDILITFTHIVELNKAQLNCRASERESERVRQRMVWTYVYCVLS